MTTHATLGFWKALILSLKDLLGSKGLDGVILQSVQHVPAPVQPGGTRQGLAAPDQANQENNQD
jgi:hypothetical protein